MNASISVLRSNWPYGVAPAVFRKLAVLFEATPGISSVWIYGSRGRGDHRDESDLDLAIDMPDGSFSRLANAIDDLELIYPVDVVHWQSLMSDSFRQRIERDRKLFWQPAAKIARAT